MAEDLETTELRGYTASNISQSHLQLTNVGGDLMSQFPPNFEATTTGALFEVLVGKRKWSSPQARLEAQLILKDPP